MQTHESFVFCIPLGTIRLELPTPAADVLDRACRNIVGEIEAIDLFVAPDGIAVRLLLERPEEHFQFRTLPEWWSDAWQRAGLPLREYQGESALVVASKVFAAVPPRKRGKRGAGNRGRREKDYLLAEVLRLTRTYDLSDRAAVREVVELAADREAPWPWQCDPATRAAENTLRKEVQRHRKKRSRKK